MADRDLSGCTLGEFVLVEKIGQGGFGSVYRAEQPALLRHVVVKVLRKHGDIAEQRFFREAQLASRFEHPFAAHLYAFGMDESKKVLWIAMELVQGVTLSAWLRRHGPMPLEQFVPFFECIADAVHVAHECGIVHRDLKPSNVMVIERGSRLLPKLLDFGIAKTLEPDDSVEECGEFSAARGTLAATVQIRNRSREAYRTATATRSKHQRQITSTGIGFGSRPYMPPEQWGNARAVSPSSDVYSLGILAYETLTGHLPYKADSTDELFRLHSQARPPSLGLGFPPQLDRVIRCALAKAPEERYHSPLELAAEFREGLQTQPREQLRSLARVWNDRARSPELLLRGGELLRTPTEVIGELERAYVAASHRRTMRAAWSRRLLAASAAALALGLVWYQGIVKTNAARSVAEVKARAAQEVAEATLTQAELERGRSALLHNEPEAHLHLAKAYDRDRSPATAFMLARSIQPRLAEQARLVSETGRMWSAAFSPDRRQIATSDDDGASLWNAQTQQRLFNLPHGDIVYQVMFNADGSRLITTCGDGAIRFWNTNNGRLVQELRRHGSKSRYYAVALSPDESHIGALGLSDTAVHIWNTNTGLLVAELRHEASDGPSLAFSHDGRWLATAGESAHVFDTKTWALMPLGERQGVRSVSWDPTSARLLTGSASGDVAILNVTDGTRLHLRDIGDPIEVVAFAPNGQLVVAATRDGTELVWDAKTGVLRSAVNYLRSKVLSMEFDHSATLIVAAGASGSVAVTNAVSGMPVSMLDGPRNVVRAAHFDSTSRRVVAASWDGTVRIWDATSSYHKWSAPPVSDDCGLVTSLEPDRRFLAVGCRDHPTRVWDTARNELLAELPSVTPTEAGFASAYPAVSVAGDRAAIARGSTVEIYELPGSRLLRSVVHGAPVNAVAFAGVGRDVVSGAVDGSVLVTRDNGAALTLPSSTAGVDAVGFLPDLRIVVADANRKLRIYSTTGDELATLETSARVRFFRMWDAHRALTVPSFMGKASAPELWDLEKYRRIAQLQEQAQVYSARFERGQILSAWSDGSARLYDGTTGQLLQTFRGGSRFLAEVAFFGDGSMIVGGGGDGLLRFWDASSGRPLWTMPAHRTHVVGLRVDGSEVITRGFSGDISRWRLPDPEHVFEACRRHERCAIVAQ